MSVVFLVSVSLTNTLKIVGIPTGAISSVVIYKLFDSAYTIGNDSAVPAPAAEAWKAGTFVVCCSLLFVQTVSVVQELK